MILNVRIHQIDVGTQIGAWIFIRCATGICYFGPGKGDAVRRRDRGAHHGMAAMGATALGLSDLRLESQQGLRGTAQRWRPSAAASLARSIKLAE